MSTVEVQLMDGTSEYFQDQNNDESYYPTSHPHGSWTVSRIEQPADGSPPVTDEVVRRFRPDEFVGWSEYS